MPHAILAAAVGRGDWREAFAIAEAMDDPKTKAAALSRGRFSWRRRRREFAR